MSAHDTRLAAAPTHPAGALLRSYCTDTGTSMRALSTSIGRGEKYVAEICSGRNRFPDPVALDALAEATGLPLADLHDPIGRDDPNTRLARAVRSGLFMSDVLDAVQQDRSIAAGTREKRLRNIQLFCETWLGKAPAQLPADPRRLSHLLQERELGPATLGISKKRFSDVLSSVRNGLQGARATPRARKTIRHVAPAWRALHDALGSSWIRPILSPFIRYCDALDIAPEAVDDAVAEAYAVYRDRYDLSEKPVAAKLTKVRTAWNKAAREIPGWPAITIAAGARTCVTLPWSAFPASFRASWEDYEANRGVPGLAEVEGKNLLERARAYVAREQPADGGSTRVLEPLADSTLSRQRESVRLIASRAVALGLVEPTEILDIGDVADPELVGHVIHEDIAARVGLQTGYADTLVKHLMSVARRWVPDLQTSELEHFRALRKVLDEEREATSGLSERDRRRLAPFLNNRETMARLVSLPAWIIDRHEQTRRTTGTVTPAMARDVRGAVAMLIEQTLPVRWGDLTRTRLDVNLLMPVQPGTAGTLYYKLSKTRKQGRREQQAPLAAWKVAYIDLYLRHYRPILTARDPANPFLFPGAVPGAPTTRLGGEVKALLFQWLGHVVNPHLWRKLMAGYLLLRTNDMNLVEDLLGHVRGSEATRVYVEMKSAWAAARLDEEVTRLTAGHRMPDDIRRRLQRAELG